VKIENVPFGTVDWEKVERVAHPGATGTAWWRTVQQGNLRVRMVEYSPGYLADHWCEKGHVLLVLEGELTTEVKGKEIATHLMRAGQCYLVADGTAPHRSHTEKGARLFIVD
jgi:quercetin dioxygenase-like cupin family protein